MVWVNGDWTASPTDPQRPIRLYPGVRICQMIFMRMQGEGSYNGIFLHNYL